MNSAMCRMGDSPGCLLGEFEKRGEVLEIGGLNIESWLLEHDFFGYSVGREYGCEVLVMVRSLDCMS